ncbi:hypothetical protein SAMN05660772_02068 [Pasteurella testudinis DSM 23072]|uniref:Uncharacterized protein n=1 Tax=Pasteurella testudinis DSM 23072 TaxID=1122938 RepID=A0A1W1UMN7_9PAST|nr:hypothetical protein [Pasteurella testudinis]SMB82347.1 hypothetical protein SAMN05660772_02068 [Pasteurella testudinis DSM 23072]SUB52246.1 Uncharacterised protein [Pasteurella testudinis]
MNINTVDLNIKKIISEIIIYSIMLGLLFFGNEGLKIFALIIASFLGFMALIGAIFKLDRDIYSKPYCIFDFILNILFSVTLAYLNFPIVAGIYFIGFFFLFAVRFQGK